MEDGAQLLPCSGLSQNATNHGRLSNTYKPQVNKNEVNQMFEKKFHYRKGDWKLPTPDEMFREFYQIDSLQELKPKLNKVKSKLNDYSIEEWSTHTKQQNPSDEIPWRLKNETKAEFVTIAWCKFFECLHSYPLVRGPHLNSLHLCELPGAFITALNHYLHSTYPKNEVQWRWLSTTLNPYYEGNSRCGMISDDRFMFHTFDNWLMHDDFTGNIISRQNIEQIQEHCKQRLENNIQLITADGSIDCADAPDCQEEVVASLHFAEITTALSILANGGCFVVKMFTLFESTSVCKLFLFNCVFEEVHVFKPATSKRGNSEVYIICIGYKKETKYLPELLERMKENVENINILPLFSKSHLPSDFLLQHEICSRLFMNFQIEAIDSNIRAYETKPTRRQVIYKQHLRALVANEFYTRYKVCRIAEEDQILYGCPNHNANCLLKVFCKGSYSEREVAKETTMEERIFALHRIMNNLEKTMDRNYGMNLHGECENSSTSVPQLRIYRGAPFTELHSSVFAHSYVMEFHQKLKETLGRDPVYLTEPSCTADDVNIPIYNDNIRSFSLLPRQFIIQLLDTIYEKQPRKIIFSNIILLTHFSVSILRFLTLCIYEHFKVHAEPQFEIELQTKCDKFTEEQMTALGKLRSLLMNDLNIICILPIDKLHRNEFANALINHNNQLLMKNFKLALDN